MRVVARDLRVSFGGIAALSGVDLELSPGEIVGLVGPNGAGKTTLFNCVTGVVSPDSGYVEVNGVDVSRMRFDRRVHSGLSRTFQTPRVNVHGSVLEAVMLGFNPHVTQPLLGSFFGSRRVRRTEADLKRRAIDLIEQLKISENPEKRAGDLSLGALRLLEVARALASDPRYVLLDEPAAGIDQLEQNTLASAIRLAGERGVGILIVEHNVPFVAGLCGKLVALVQGKIVASGVPASVLSDREFVKAYLGTDDGQ